jgi:hypothetical protein
VRRARRVASACAWPSHALSCDGLGRRYYLMETKQVTVTPEMAKLLLSQNSNNRRLIQANVDFLASQIVKGDWKLTHQGIAVSKSGRLLDGQHRLAAVIKAGAPVGMMLTTGLPDDIFDVLDTGRARRASDTLSIAGAKSPKTLASAVKLKMLYEKWPERIWVSDSAKCSSHEILANYEAAPLLWDRVVAIADGARLHKVLVPGPFAAMAFLAVSQGVELSRVELLALDLKQGSALRTGNPVLAYRNKAIGSPAMSSTNGAQRRLAEYIKLLNSCLSLTDLKMFKTPSIPPMPRILADEGVWA